MKILKLTALFILYIIGPMILAVILALATLFTYFPLQMFLFGRGDYLLFVSSNLNIVPVIMILILIIYAFIQLKEKFLKRKDIPIEPVDEHIDIETLTKREKSILKLLDTLESADVVFSKVFKILKLCYIPALLIALYCGMSSYAIVYQNSIRVSSPTKPAGVTYNYSDITLIDVGVQKEKRNSYSPYYTITFNDGTSVNLFGASMMEGKDIGFEYILLDLDKTLLAKGIKKIVSKQYFENYSKDLDKDFVSRVEKLFDEK